MDHLAPEAHAVVEGTAAERLNFMRRPKWFGYPAVDVILERMESLLDYPTSHRTPGMMLLGDSNSGKSALCLEFLARHPVDPNLNGEAVKVPVLYIEMPPGPEQHLLFDAILTRLGQPFRARDPLQTKMKQVRALLATVGCRMLIIDEFQHVLGPRHDKRRILLDTIKHMSNDLHLPIVVAGTTETHLAVSKDEQLINRLTAVWMPVWTMDQEFRRLLATYEVLLPLRERSRLQTRDTAALILAVSEGRMGEIRDLLCLAVQEALRQGRESVDAEFLRSLPWVAPSKRRLHRPVA